MMGFSHRHTRYRNPPPSKREQGFYECHSGQREWNWVKPKTCRRCREFDGCVEKTGRPTAFHTYMSEVMQGLREPIGG